MAAQAGHPLSEEETLNLERGIPGIAAVATQAAHFRALSAGRSVLIVEGSNLVEAHPDGSRTVIRQAAPRRKVAKGKTITMRRAGDDASPQA
ncbi:hypothetical protein [Pseudomonas sp. NPDC007930]|uniref:hypothetical protein n=1 Tax=Pseudomonas sp. NPDC007930 TaxID=3364417 RepID=UPI0036ED44B7